MESYSRGWYTHVEVAGAVLQSIDAQNAAEILGMLPESIISYLAKRASDAPLSEEDWAQLKLISIRGDPPSVPVYRAAIEVIRSHLRIDEPIA